MKRKKTPSFSEQIRDGIESCGTTQYSLAKQVGVSAAVLSRFMTGKQGMNLETLDKLAEAIGLEVTVTIRNVNRPEPKGRKPAKEKQVASATTTSFSYWRELAKIYARDAHEDYFPSRRGIWFLKDVKKLCVYNNNPYQDPKQRPAELAVFREQLLAEGIRELGFGEYPEAGPDLPEGELPGYTFAMILDCGAERESWVAFVWRNILRQARAARNQSD